MKNLLKNNLIKNYLILLMFFTILEITFRLISGLNVFSYALLRIFIGLNFISLLISFILSWFNKHISKALTLLIAFAVNIYAFVELGFNNFIGVYVSVNTSSQLGAVTSYIKDFLKSFLPKFYLMFIPFILLMLYYIFLDKYTEKKIEKRFPLKTNIVFEPGIRTITTILALVVISLCYNYTLTANFMQNKLQTVSNKDLFSYPSVPSIVVNQFGILGFGVLDIKSKGTVVSEDVSFALNTDTTKKSDNEVDDTVDDTLWNELINNETDIINNNINKYLISNNTKKSNEKTGIFEGKNLIVIMMESTNDIIINKDLYPNFYKLYTGGIVFENNYSPRNSCATGNNEFSGMTGLYTIQNNCTANIYKDNTYFTSIFNLFNRAGYKTSSMHDYTEHYYARSIIHKNLGSGIYYGVESLGIPYYSEYRNWASDEDFMEKAMDITLSDNSDEPFMLWLTTVSAHQPYGVSSVEGDKYLDLTENTDYPIDLRRYMSKLKTFDNSLGILLSRLEESGKLDDTVIALYGDHYPYGLKNDTISNVLTYDLEDYEVERTPMVIYNSKINHEVVEKYSSYINLTPTLANMFNLDYDARYYMGADVFSKNYLDLVVFADGSWKNKDAYYNASDATIKYTSDKTYNVDKVLEINNIVTGRMQVSASIIRNNYFNYLETNLKELEAAKQNWEENE